MTATSRFTRTQPQWKCCWVGGARYHQPLDETSEKKFRALQQLGEMHVIGLSIDRKPRHFVQYVLFYLLPQWRSPALRYMLYLIASPIIILTILKRHNLTILVAQSPYEGFAAALAKILARLLFRKKLALIVENHGDFENDLFMQRKIRLRFIYQFLMRVTATFSLHQADALRAISKTTEEQLHRFTGRKAIANFPTWTDIKVFQDAGRSERDNQTRFILYVGVLIPRKGVHFLLESFGRIASTIEDVKLVLIGESQDDDYSKALRKVTQSLGPDQRVTFMGPKTQPELAEFMAGAEVLVLPSLSEGLGRVILEAMACGTPVIGSAVGGIPDMIHDGQTGLLTEPGNVPALAEKISWILEHPKEASAMGRRAQQFAQDYFSVDLYLQGYKDLFTAVSSAQK